MIWRDALREVTWRDIARELTVALAMMVGFSLLFILGSLVIYQKLPRLK